jgi:hypothetical protein
MGSSRSQVSPITLTPPCKIHTLHVGTSMAYLTGCVCVCVCVCVSTEMIMMLRYYTG